MPVAIAEITAAAATSARWLRAEGIACSPSLQAEVQLAR